MEQLSNLLHSFGKGLIRDSNPSFSDSKAGVLIHLFQAPGLHESFFLPNSSYSFIILVNGVATFLFLQTQHLKYPSPHSGIWSHQWVTSISVVCPVLICLTYAWTSSERLPQLPLRMSSLCPRQNPNAYPQESSFHLNYWHHIHT